MSDGHHWVSRRRMLEFLDRLKHPSHRDYDTILEIEEQLENGWDAQEQANDAEVFEANVRELCAEAGLIAVDDDETDVLPLLRMFLPVE